MSNPKYHQSVEVEPVFPQKKSSYSGHFPISLMEENHGYHHLGYHDLAFHNQVNSIDHTVHKLFACMSIAYNNNSVQLAAPQFRAFKGFEMITVKDKMRLNNIVWREWHMQFVDPVLRKKRQKICNFAAQMENTHDNATIVILEGKYWKRSNKVVINEYRKWRVFFKERMKHWRPDQVEEIPVDELLQRLATEDHNTISTFVQNQNIRAHYSPPDFTPADFEMDMSDNLISTLNSFGFPHGNNFHGLDNSDFMQPALIALEPELDFDFSQSEPLQDLLADVMNFPIRPGKKRSGIADPFPPPSESIGDMPAAFPAHKRHRSCDGQPAPDTDRLLAEILTSGGGYCRKESTVTTPITTMQHAPVNNNYNQVPLSSTSHTAVTRTPLSQFGTQTSMPAIPKQLSMEDYRIQFNSMQQSANQGNLASQNQMQTTRSSIGTTQSHAMMSPTSVTPQVIVVTQNDHQSQFKTPTEINLTTQSQFGPPTVFSQNQIQEQHEPRPQYSSSIRKNLTNRLTTQRQFSAPISSAQIPLNTDSGSFAQNFGMASGFKLEKTDMEFKTPELPPAKPDKSAAVTSSFLEQLLSNSVLENSADQQITASSTSSSGPRVRPVYFPPFTPIAYNPDTPGASGGAGSRGFPFPGPADISSQSEDDRRDRQTAEQRRRHEIKAGFEKLAELVPTVATATTSKASKSNILSKTFEFISKLDHEKNEMEAEMAVLDSEIKALDSAIAQCHSQLPATGLPTVAEHKEHMSHMLEQYMSDQTQRNWKFYVFSKLAAPLFQSYCGMVSTANVDEMYRTCQAWIDQHCTLGSLRPVVVTSLQDICSETSILSDPTQFPEQARNILSQTVPNQRPQPEKQWQFG